MKMASIGLGILMVAWPAAAQTKSLSCDERNSNRNQVTHCEMREQTVAYAGRLSVDAGVNGGVSVKGWDGGGVLVRSKVEAQADDDGTAQSMVAQVVVNASAGQVSATGPDQSKGHGWQVSYEIFVPKQADLALKANNGGISISDVRGNITFDTMNGGVSLKRLAGEVTGTTMNGGLTVELAGSRWDGTKLDAKTVNGGVTVNMPENYSAHFETATVNGNLNIGVPMTVTGEIGKRVVTDLGSGGPTIHVETTNGGVNVKKM
jgi:Putative adhesin